jgi:hypothetical protein
VRKNTAQKLGRQCRTSQSVASKVEVCSFYTLRNDNWLSLLGRSMASPTRIHAAAKEPTNR